MLASFKIKGSKVSLDGIDISGAGNSLEVLIYSKVAETLGCRLPGKVSTLVKQKAFFKKGAIEELEDACREGKFYKFSRDQLQYEMKDVEIALSKHECIAGVVPVELAVSGEEKPTRKRLMTL